MEVEDRHDRAKKSCKGGVLLCTKSLPYTLICYNMLLPVLYRWESLQGSEGLWDLPKVPQLSKCQS